jgi:hypothetical protein
MDTLDGRGLSRVVAKADLLKLAARAQNDLLAEFLGDSPEDSPENTPDAAPLYAAGPPPQELGQLWAAAVAARDKSPADLPAARSGLLRVLSERVVPICDELRIPLEEAAKRWFG